MIGFIHLFIHLANTSWSPRARLCQQSHNRVSSSGSHRPVAGGREYHQMLTQAYEEVRRPIQDGKVGLPWKEEKVLPSEWRQHTHPGELMIRKALGFGSTMQKEVMRSMFWGHNSHASISPFGKGPSDPTGSLERLGGALQSHRGPWAIS